MESLHGSKVKEKFHKIKNNMANLICFVSKKSENLKKKYKIIIIIIKFLLNYNI